MRSAWDILRFVVFVEAALIEAFCIAVLRVYYTRYRQAVGHGTGGRRDGDTPWIGLMPLHVCLVTVSTMILVASHTWIVIGRTHLGMRWYVAPTAFAAFTILLVALWTVAVYEYRLVR